MLPSIARAVCVLALGALAFLPAAASGARTQATPADTSDPADDPAAPRELEVRLRLSGWAAAFGGDVAAHGAATHVSASLGESFELENLGAAAEVDVRWRRLLLRAGGRFVDLDDELETPSFRMGLPGALLPVSVPGFERLNGLIVVPPLVASVPGGEVDVDVQHVTGELLLGYRLVSRPLPRWLGGAERGERRRFDFDLLAGARYHDLETRIDVSLPPAELEPFSPIAVLFADRFVFELPVATSFAEAVTLFEQFRRPVLVAEGLDETLLSLHETDLDFRRAEIPDVSLDGFQRRFEADAHWLDPVIGVQLGVDVTEWLRLRARGDVGGFDLGSASDFAWTGEVAVVVRLAEHLEAELAWFAAGLERDRAAGSIDYFAHGPQASLVFRF